MRCHNFADCPPSVSAESRCPFRVLVSWCPAAAPRKCHISESLLTSGLWLQQLMESFPPAPPTAPRLPFIRLSRQDTAASWRCPQTILLNHHFPPSPSTRSTPSRHPSAHCACGNFFVLFSVASASFRFIIKIWLAANSGSF